MKSGLRGVFAFLAVVGWWLLAAPAQAAWIKAETDKFIVYGQGGEASVRDFATKLDLYDQVLRALNPATLNRRPATKVQVIVLPRREGLKQVNPDVGPLVLGFYRATTDGVLAFAVERKGFGPDDVLFHEYAHHFMLDNFPAAYPAWFVEGWAEYYMTTDIKDGRITVGSYNQGRVDGILAGEWLPLALLLSRTTAEINPDWHGAFYAEAWLLTHYMLSDPERARQLNTALMAIAKGEDPVKALSAATGRSMAELTGVLERYHNLRTIVLAADALPRSAMTVTALPPSADDLFLDQMRLMGMEAGAEDPRLLADIRRDAARWPGDALAERTLARAEFMIGEPAVGEAIMARRLAAAPDDREDLLLAGLGRVLTGVRDKDVREARFRGARALLAKAYALDKTDFRPLYAYALSRSIEPGYPTDNDLNAWAEARSLAPAVAEISLRGGMALVQKGRREEAARVLARLINDPHGGELAAQARALLEGSDMAAGPDK
jgi:hypothetical protein